MTDVVPASGRLVLIRHGQTSWNATRRFQGQTDIPLDSSGREQATSVASFLAASSFSPDVFLCSDLSRAAETASIIGSRLDLVASSDARLREIELGTWQGLTTDEALARFPSEYAEWRAGVDVRRGGGETYVEVAARATACVGAALSSYPAGVGLVVTHGGTARALIGSLCGLAPASWSALGPLGNCRISVLGAAGSRGWRLLSHNGVDLG